MMPLQDAAEFGKLPKKNWRSPYFNPKFFLEAMLWSRKYSPHLYNTIYLSNRPFSQSADVAPVSPTFLQKNTKIEVYINRAQGFKIVYNQAWLIGGMGSGKKLAAAMVSNDEMIIADNGLIHSDRTSLKPPTAM